MFTIGHGTQPVQTFIEALLAAGVSCAVDVRRFPGSRRNPQFGAAPLAASLRQAGLRYVGMPELGGRRRAAPDSPNLALRNAAFRGYADFMRTPPFLAALDDLLRLAARESTAVFCAETLWWRCHRRLIADAAVLLHGAVVIDLVGTTAAAHRLTPGVRYDDGLLAYDIGV